MSSSETVMLNVSLKILISIKYRFFLYTILFCSDLAFAQAQIDSLKLALKNAKHDTTRCNILNELIEIASDEEWPGYNEQLLKLAEKCASNTNTGAFRDFYLRYFAGALNNVGIIYNDQGDIPKALEFYNKSLKIREEIHDKMGIANSLNNIGFIYSNKGNIIKAIEFYHKSLKIQEEIQDKSGIATTLNNISFLYDQQGNIPKALEFLHRSSKIQEEIQDKTGIARSLNNIGMIHYNQGDIHKALEFYFKSLKILEETLLQSGQVEDKMGVAQSLNNIGGVYQNQNDIPKALEFYIKSLKIYEEIQHKKGIATSLINIGFIYGYNGIPSCRSSGEDCLRAGRAKALELYYKSLHNFEEIQDKSGIASALNNIGFIYDNHGDPSCRYSEEDCRVAGRAKALELYFKSFNIHEEIQDKSGIALSLNNIGGILLKQGKLATALDYATRSLRTAKELGFPRNIKDAANTLKNIYRKQNNFKEAFKMYELELQMRDSINNNETRKESVKKQFQYDYEKKEAVANAEHKSELEKQQAVADEKNRRQKIVIWSVVGGLLLILFFAGYVSRSLKITRKQKQVIEIKNKETEEQKKVIEEKQKEILDSIRYAKRIQTALLPNEKYMARHVVKK